MNKRQYKERGIIEEILIKKAFLIIDDIYSDPRNFPIQERNPKTMEQMKFKMQNEVRDLIIAYIDRPTGTFDFITDLRNILINGQGELTITKEIILSDLHEQFAPYMNDIYFALIFSHGSNNEQGSMSPMGFKLLAKDHFTNELKGKLQKEHYLFVKMLTNIKKKNIDTITLTLHAESTPGKNAEKNLHFEKKFIEEGEIIKLKDKAAISKVAQSLVFYSHSLLGVHLQVHQGSSPDGMKTLLFGTDGVALYDAWYYNKDAVIPEWTQMHLDDYKKDMEEIGWKPGDKRYLTMFSDRGQPVSGPQDARQMDMLRHLWQKNFKKMYKSWGIETPTIEDLTKQKYLTLENLGTSAVYLYLNK